MAVPIDTSQPLLRPSQLERLVRAVYVADEHDEHDWIEWKATLDFASAEGKWHVAKQILGFANRTVATAQRHMGGHAYLLVGVQPGALSGVASIDNAIMTSVIARYVGPARWSLEQVQVDGKKVVVVIVDPPMPGDDPFTLRKAYAGFPEGAIFVRSPGRSEQASPVQVQALIERAKATRAVLDINIRTQVATIEFGPLLGESQLDAIIAEERAVLMAPRRSQRAAPTAQGALRLSEAYASLAAAASNLQGAVGERPDRRSEADYAREVEAYLDKLRLALTSHHQRERFRSPGASLRLAVDNPTDRNFQRLHVVAHVEGEVRRWDTDLTDALYRAGKLPKPPVPLGTATKERRFALPSVQALGLAPATTSPPRSKPSAGFKIENTGSVTIQFEVIDVRPHTPTLLPAVPLVVFEPVGKALSVAWEATAANVDGLRRGAVEIVVIEQSDYHGPSASGTATD